MGTDLAELPVDQSTGKRTHRIRWASGNVKPPIRAGINTVRRRGLQV